ncbi:MAG TPA: hypothetical protein VFR71_01920 [Methyloceanibacter sp.]|nr:hypothetical protein [Methyloceanibacter sp.]
MSVLSILLAGCSTIVKVTEQQVSVNTPGVTGAICQLQSPAIGTRTDPWEYCLAEEPA